MKYRLETKIIGPIIILVISAMLAGCIDKTLPVNNTGNDSEVLVINYIDDTSILTKEDFPDFEPMIHEYAIASENMTVTVNTEGSHSTYLVYAGEEIPDGYRIYGSSESYNSSEYINKSLDKNVSKNVTERYILLQYKVFDDDKKIDYLLNMTVSTYTKSGFKSKVLNNTNVTYKGRVFILESTNDVGMNRIIILFGYNTVIGKVAVQDYGDRSLEESLKILNIAFDRIKVNTKNVSIVKEDIIKMYNTTVNKTE